MFTVDKMETVRQLLAVICIIYSRTLVVESTSLEPAAKYSFLKPEGRADRKEFKKK